MKSTNAINLGHIHTAESLFIVVAAAAVAEKKDNYSAIMYQNLKDTHTHVYLPPQTINKDVLKNIELCTNTHTHTQTKA